MTYKNLNKIKSILLMPFTIFIFMHNCQYILSTRNWPFFSIKFKNPKQFIVNKLETKERAKVALLHTKYSFKSSQFYEFLPQVSDYFNNNHTRSSSSLGEWVLRVNQYIKSCIESVKVLVYSSLFSLKYRFFSLENQAVIMRKNIAWILEGNFSTREATLGKAFVFADLSGAPESIYHSFKVIGILHLVAASSANIYLILAFFKPLLALLEYFYGQKYLAFGKMLIVVLYFLLINGHFNLIDSSPSILRASLCCILAILAALYMNLAISSLNILICVGIICLLINPLYLQSLGFQLSFLASFIILFYWPYVKKKIVKSSIMLGVLVQFLLWPLLVFYFSDINLTAIPANIVVSPLVEFLTVLFFVFIFLKIVSLALLADFVSTLISSVSNIFFNILNLLEKMPAKSIAISTHKSLIISSLILVHLFLFFLIYREQKLFNKKNKYRVFNKWANWNN